MPKPPPSCRPSHPRRRSTAPALPAAGRVRSTLLAALALASSAALLAWLVTEPDADLFGWRLPARHNPWAPLAIDDAPNWLTRYKLARLDERPAECRALLTSAALQAESLPDRETGAGCALRNAVRVRRLGQLRVGEPFILSCRAAASLALWERHSVAPLAQQWFGEPVQRLEHFGSYACRNVYGRDGAPRSQHATADALDVAAFVLQDGRRIGVARDWAGNGAAAGFLHAVHDGACGWFDGVLGPDYNREHADHFHLDRGPYRVCR